MLKREGLATVALVLFAAAVLSFTGYVLVRDDPPPSAAGAGTEPRVQSPSPSSTPTESEPDPEPEPEPLDLLVLGDESARGGWPSRVAEGADATVRNLARSGTGYLATATKEQCGSASCTNLKGTMPLVRQQGTAYDAVLISSGDHDRTLPVDEVKRAIVAFFEDLHAALPDAQIVVVLPAEVKRFRPAITRAAESVGGRAVPGPPKAAALADLIAR